MRSKLRASAKGQQDILVRELILTAEVVRLLASARWVTVDDTAARHARQEGVTTRIGNDHGTAFRTGVPWGYQPG